MDRFARTVYGYHGCSPEFADRLLRGEVALADWKASANEYDWLGHGIYFWEYAPERAQDWRDRKGRVMGGVVGAVIQLGNCLDLSDLKDTQRLLDHYNDLKTIYDANGTPLPTNEGGRNVLDCLVINSLVRKMALGGREVQSVRCPFIEGAPAYPGSAISTHSHVQLVVRDRASILGIFRPNF